MKKRRKMPKKKKILATQEPKPTPTIEAEEMSLKTSRLEEIMNIQSKSYDQDKMVSFIEGKITEYGGVFEYDVKGNLYGTKGDAKTYPCVVAHTDTVHAIIPNKYYKVLTVGDKMFAIDYRDCNRTGIGGDDKVGIFLALECFKNQSIMKVAFFLDEEVGCRGSNDANYEWFDNVSFAMQGDRRGYYDVTKSIMGLKMYDDKFKEAVKPIFERYGKEEVTGGLTDVYTLGKRKVNICMFNSSCGYYAPHTKDEYIVISEVMLTYEFFKDCVDTLFKEGERWEMKRKSSYSQDYNYRDSGTQLGFYSDNYYVKRDKGHYGNRQYVWDKKTRQYKRFVVEDATPKKDESDGTCPNCDSVNVKWDKSVDMYWCFECQSYVNPILF